MSKKKQEEGTESTLTLAARELDEEIAKFEALAEATRKAPLDSQKHIEQAARAARDAVDSEERFSHKVRALVEAVSNARDRQHQAAEVINARVAEVNSRAEAFAALQREFAALGESARGINEQIKGVATGEATDGDRAKLAAIREVGEKLGQAADRAGELTEKAREQGFVDLTHDADGLRQQLVAAKNKLHLVEQALQPV